MHLVWMLNMILFFKQCQGEYDEEFKNYKGCQLLSVTPQTSTEFEYLKKLYKTNAIGIEFWRQPIAKNRTVSLQVCPNANKKAKHALKQMKHKVEIEDIQKNIDDDSTAYKHLRHFGPTACSLEDFKFDDYHSLEEINQLISFTVKKYPKVMEVEKIGTTVGNNSLQLIKLRKKSKDTSIKKKIFWLDSGTHAREWVTIASVLYILKQLLTSTATDIQSMFDKFDFYILLVANPDGYTYTWSKHRMWRKNRNKPPKNTCTGIDVNRNYDIDFDGSGEGSEGVSCSEIYRGPGAFSEKESQAIRDAATKIKDNLEVFISVHAFSQMWLLPYGYKKEKPKTYDQLYSMAMKMIEAIKAVNGTEYTAGTIQDLLYPTSGSSLDWAYDVLKVKYAYSVELRDMGSYGFLLPKAQIIPTAEELFVAIKVLAKNV